MQFSPLFGIEHKSIDQALSILATKTLLGRASQGSVKPSKKMPWNSAGLVRRYHGIERNETDPLQNRIREAFRGIRGRLLGLI
jgi:hypothetical protein